MSVTVTFEGLDKMMEICDPARFTREIDREVGLIAARLRDETKKMPPVNKQRNGFEAIGIPVAPLYGGGLRQSIQARKVALMAADVFTGVNYGEYVHDGTSRMPARPFFQWMLDYFQGREIIEVSVKAALDRVISP